MRINSKNNGGSYLDLEAAATATSEAAENSETIVTVLLEDIIASIIAIRQRGQPKIQKPKNFAPRCKNIIKMIRVTFWVLVFAKTQKGPFYHFNYLFTPRY
jgi:hypothetical protein